MSDQSEVLFLSVALSLGYLSQVFSDRSTAKRKTRDQLRIAIVTWNARNYHRSRRQKQLSGLTPVEYEAIMDTGVALAA